MKNSSESFQFGSVSYGSFTQAEKAAEKFFSDNFNYDAGVGYSTYRNKFDMDVYEFYSKDDPAMDDTFKCLVVNWRAQETYEDQAHRAFANMYLQ